MALSELNIYRDKRVFITGHTGFKGTWLSLMLKELGAKITGYSLPPGTAPNHFDLLQNHADGTFGDICNAEKLKNAIQLAAPEIVFHLAAQPLVRGSYTDPVNTYQTNIIGTLNLLEAARSCSNVKAAVLITTDKVYDNKENGKAYAEADELGGYDMYSSSKACCEILISSYRNAFLNADEYGKKHHLLIASARAGNVIGGGDWNPDRLLPDIAKAVSENRPVHIRNPRSVRPWQHVLDCQYGYLLLGARLLNGQKEFSRPFNFSPAPADVKNVEEIAAIAKKSWEDIDIAFGEVAENYHEAGSLMLDSSAAGKLLGWKPVWNTEEAVGKTIEWYKAFYKNDAVISEGQVKEYLTLINAR